jgi:hypothetical protein
MKQRLPLESIKIGMSFYEPGRNSEQWVTGVVVGCFGWLHPLDHMGGGCFHLVASRRTPPNIQHALSQPQICPRLRIRAIRGENIARTNNSTSLSLVIPWRRPYDDEVADSVVVEGAKSNQLAVDLRHHPESPQSPHNA